MTETPNRRGFSRRALLAIASAIVAALVLWQFRTGNPPGTSDPED